MHLHKYDALLAVGARHSIVSGDVRSLDHFIKKHRGWKFGHLSYELKNQLHGYTGRKEDLVGFPDFHFFCSGDPASIAAGRFVNFCRRSFPGLPANF